MMKEVISSLVNPKIKNLVKLQEKSSERKKQNLIVFEGFRELGLAISSNCIVKTLFVCQDLWQNKPLGNIPKSSIIEISKDVFNKVAYRENVDGIIAVVEPNYLSLDSLKLSANPFIIILEGVEKPGNLGAILRTADAAQVDAVIICDPKTDIYNPNAIRSSVGCVFTTQTTASTNEEVLAWLDKNNITAYSAALTANKYYQDIDFTKSCAIVMGTESTGLSDFWLNKAHSQIKIPMRGKIDSLNVGTSAAILTFEAMRQRGF